MVRVHDERYCVYIYIILNWVDVVDNIWKTCCALHNLLLDKDGVSDHWYGEIGLFDFDKELDNIPFSLQRLENGQLIWQYDSFGMG